jgi:competence ComEA-like helix-hairpin-helix protein
VWHRRAVALYSRHQLLVLLAVVAAFGGGLAVERWRHAHPETVDRIERLDRTGSLHDATGPDEHQGGIPFRRLKLGADGSVPNGTLIDLNRATLEELTGLPGVGPSLAARIIEARTIEPFSTVEDLRRVRGLGESKLERVRSLVTVAPR